MTKAPHKSNAPEATIEEIKSQAQELRAETKAFFDTDSYTQQEILASKGIYNPEVYYAQLEERSTKLGYQLLAIIDKEAQWEDGDPEEGTRLEKEFHDEIIGAAEAKVGDADKINAEMKRVNRKYSISARSKMEEFAAENGWGYDEMIKIQRGGINEYNKAVQGIDERTHPQLAERLKTLSDATYNKLKEVRGLGGELDADSKTKPLLKKVNESLQVYPSDWIQASNDNPGRMLVKEASRRAHYSGYLTPQYAIISPPLINNRFKREQLEASPQEFDKTAFFTNSAGQSIQDHDKHIVEQAGMFSDNPKDKKPKEDFSSFDHPQKYRMNPKAKWEWKAYSVYNNGTFTTKEGWVATAQRKSKRKTKIGEQSEMTVSKGYDNDNSGNVYKSAAVHEFAHRSQESVPGIAEMESAFRKRREYNTAEGRRESQVIVTPGTSEVGYKDDYAIPYIGKEYGETSFAGRRYRPTEVLSVGMESLFLGTNGGLKGITTKEKKDDDHRAFCLGLLMTR